MRTPIYISIWLDLFDNLWKLFKKIFRRLTNHR